MEVDNMSNYSSSTNSEHSHRLEIFINNHPLIENAPLYKKDDTLDIGYVFTNPMTIVNSKTYKKIGSIQIEPAHTGFISMKQFCGFFFDDAFYLLVYSLNNEFFLYRMYLDMNYNYQKTTKGYSNTCVSVMLNTNISGRIVKCQYIKNAIGLNYFMIVNDSSKLFFLTIKFKPIVGEVTAIETSNNLLSFFSFTSTYNPNDNLSGHSLFIMNPYSYSTFQILNYQNNILLLLTENYLKIIQFKLLDTVIVPEIVYTDYNIKQKLLGKVNEQNGLIEILASDCYFEREKRTLNVYIMTKTSMNHFFLYKLEISTNKEIPNNLSQIDMTNLYEKNPIGTYMIVNKYKDELFILLGRVSTIYLNRKEKVTKYLSYKIDSINSTMTPDTFYIEIFDIGRGVRRIQKKENLLYQDITDQVVSEIEEKMFIKNEPQINIMNDVVSYEEGDSKEIDDYLKKYIPEFERKSIVSQEAKEDYQNIVNKSNYDLLYLKVKELVRKIINDDSLNIEAIDKRNPKAEFVIVEYLEYKLQRVNNILLFLQNVEFLKLNEESTKQQKETMYEIYKTIEKLIVTINIRKCENKILSERFNNTLSGNTTLNTSPLTFFFTDFYSKMRMALAKDVAVPFTKQFLYGKLSNINETFVSNFFISIVTILQSQTFSNRDKANFIISIIEMINVINEEISMKYQEINKSNDIFINYRDSFWGLNKKNLDDNLLGLYKAIISFKQIKEGDLISNEMIFNLARSLLVLYRFYFGNFNNSSDHKKDFYKKKIEILSQLVPYDYLMCYNMTKEFDDFNTIAVIAYSHKKELYNDFKEYIKSKNYKERLFALKQVLKLEIENVQKDNQSSIFSYDYFDDFSEFVNELSIIVKKYPKLSHLFNLFLNHLRKDINTNTYVTPSEDFDVVLSKTSNINDDVNIYHMMKTQKAMQLTALARQADSQIDLMNTSNAMSGIILLAKGARYPLNKEAQGTIYQQFIKLTEYLLGDYFFYYCNEFSECKNICFGIMKIVYQMKNENKISIEDEERIKRNTYINAIHKDCNKVTQEMAYYKISTLETMQDELRNYILFTVITYNLINMYPESLSSLKVAIEEVEKYEETQVNNREHLEYIRMLKLENKI